MAAVLAGVLAVVSTFAVRPVAGAPRAATPVQTPPPTPVPPNGSPSPFPTILHTPPPSTSPPPVAAASAVVEDMTTGQLLFRKEPDAERPVGSLTKVMTAYLVLKAGHLDALATVSRTAVAQTGSVLGARVGERLPVRELLYALLLESANDAAVTLAEHEAGSVAAFVGRMNAEAAALGLHHTRFASPNGLNDTGYSTALDLATLARAAYRRPLFAKIVRTKAHDVRSADGPIRHVQNRNVLLWLYPGAIGVKTGFTTPAGHCVIAAAVRGNRRLMAVVLGERDEAFDDGATLLDYGFAGFRAAAVTRLGEPVGPVRIDGTAVPAVSAERLVRLLRRDVAPDVRFLVHSSPGLSFPLAAGERVGRAVVLVNSRPAGVVAIASARDVAGPPPSPSPSASRPPGRATRTGGDDLARLTETVVTVLRAVFEPLT